MKIPFNLLANEKTTRLLGTVSLFARRNAPQAAFGLGVVGVVTSGVMACRATLRLPEEIDKMEDEISNADKENGRKMMFVYGSNAGKLVRLYAPSVGVGVASIGLLTGSHVALTRRNNSLAAAYAVLNETYSRYRSNVEAELGEDKENEIYTNSLHVADSHGVKFKPGTYSRLFDEFNVNWQRNPGLNYTFVKVQENYANYLLHSRGYVFLNEVYEKLGFDRTPEGQIIGWRIGSHDNYISFGLDLPATSDFSEGTEKSVWLDFNVDGNILGSLKHGGK